MISSSFILILDLSGQALMEDQSFTDTIIDHVGYEDKDRNPSMDSRWLKW